MRGVQRGVQGGRAGTPSPTSPAVRAMALVAGDAQLLAGSDDRSATLWDVRQERCAATYRCV